MPCCAAPPDVTPRPPDQSRRHSRSMINSVAPATLCLTLAWLASPVPAVPSPAPPPASTLDASPPVTSIPADDDNSELLLVHAVFRHGARTPVDTYSADPYINSSFAPVGWGHLTNKGKLQLFQLGEFLRGRYDALLGELYLPRVLEVRSTAKERTIMSAQLALAGMWPPAPAQRWHPTLRWQPVPVKTVPVDMDSLLLGFRPCPRYHVERARLLAEGPVAELLRNLDAPGLFGDLERHTREAFADPDDVQSLYNTLKAEEEFGLSLPEWTKEYYPDRLAPITALSFDINAYTTDMKKVKGGPLLKKIMEDSQRKANGTLDPPDRKFYMYSAHDTTVVNILKSLGAWETQVPGYGILALIELHLEKESGQHGIKVFLRNSTNHEPYQLSIPNCGNFCPLPRLLELFKDQVSGDLEEFCKTDDPNYIPPKDTPL